MLSYKMKEWKALKLKIVALETEISKEVIALDKTQKFEGVTASLRNGRKTFDYELAAKGNKQHEIIERHTKAKVDWKSVCADALIYKIPFSQSGKSVNLSIDK